MLRYAFVGGKRRWSDSPKNMSIALEYAQRVVKGRLPEFEDKFHRANAGVATGYGSARYAIDILKQRWAGLVKPRKDGKINEEEIIIVGAPGEAREYVNTFMPGQRWAEFEKSALESGHLSTLLSYTKEIVKGRMPELEQAILSGAKNVDADPRGYGTDPDLALEYAQKRHEGPLAGVRAATHPAHKVREGELLVAIHPRGRVPF